VSLALRARTEDQATKGQKKKREENKEKMI